MVKTPTSVYKFNLQYIIIKLFGKLTYVQVFHIIPDYRINQGLIVRLNKVQLGQVHPEGTEELFYTARSPEGHT